MSVDFWGFLERRSYLLRREAIEFYGFLLLKGICWCELIGFETLLKVTDLFSNCQLAQLSR
jgi:hypothetical protein